MRPYRDIIPGSSLDFSAIVPRDKPAGTHGRIVARGPHFEFEKNPGVPVRFYGVNLCFGANFGSWEEAQGLGERLACVGYEALITDMNDASFLYEIVAAPIAVN